MAKIVDLNKFNQMKRQSNYLVSHILKNCVQVPVRDFRTHTEPRQVPRSVARPSLRRSRHQWSGKTGYGKDNSSVACLHCDCVRQFVGGKPTYFLNDTVYDKAPECSGQKKEVLEFSTNNPRFNS